MARKNYQVKAKTGEAWQSIHEQLINSDSADSLIPTRKVTCKNPLYDSPRRGTYQLSLAEVEQLRLHSNVLSVELDPGYHGHDTPECLPPLELFSNDRFSNPVKNYRALVKPSTTDVVEVTNSLRMTSGNTGEGTTNWINVRDNSGNSPAMLYWDQLPTILTDYGVYKSIPADTTDADPELDNLLDTVNVIQLTTSGPHQLVVCADAKICRVEWWKGTSGGAGGTKSFPQTEAWSSKRDLTSDIMEDYAKRGIKYEVLNLGYLSAGEHTIKCWIENGAYPNQAFESWDYNPGAIAWQLLRLPIDGYTSDYTGTGDAYQDITTWPTIIPKTSPTSSEKNRTGYQTLRTSSDYNNNWGSNDDVPVTSNISYTNDGWDVDIIILDDGVWSGHPEFISTDDDPPNWIPGNVLSKIAQISSEIQLEEKDIIFREGDSGNSLFVIISGKVDIIKNNQIIANLEQGNCIGEMSLLDQEPRSADAISNGETILLKIDQDGFFELMSGSSEIMKQIVKMLTKRLRQTNKKLTDFPK